MKQKETSVKQDIPSDAHALRHTLVMLALAVVSAVTLVLTGCASPGDTRSTAQPLPPARIGLAADTPLPAVNAEWWKTFGDPALDALVSQALADHPSLQIVAARAARATAAVEGARAAEQPSADLSLNATRQRYTENGLIPAPLAGNVRTDTALQAGVSWELDLFGRRRAALESAIGAQRAAVADAQAARVLLASNVVRAYVGLARSVAQREVARRALAQRQELLSLVQQRVQAGLDTNVELRQGEGALPDARLSIAQLDEQITLARHQLAALTAQAPDALATLSPALAPVQAVVVPDRLGADLIGRRADIVAARWRVEAASGDVALARAQFYPDINLVAFAGFSAIGLNQLLDSGSRQAGFGPAITLPLFDAGRLRANLKGRSADLDAAIQGYNGVLLDAVRDAADQIASLQSIERQQREQAAAQASAESAYDLAVQRYRAGLGSYLTVLNAESSLLAQRRQAADLKARALDTQVLLIRSLGGGWQDPAPALAALNLPR
jgi:NodT family efflux transporter outer membrane factor (OMF) lipoprotein